MLRMLATVDTAGGKVMEIYNGCGLTPLILRSGYGPESVLLDVHTTVVKPCKLTAALIHTSLDSLASSSTNTLHALWCI